MKLKIGKCILLSDDPNDHVIEEETNEVLSNDF